MIYLKHNKCLIGNNIYILDYHTPLIFSTDHNGVVQMHCPIRDDIAFTQNRTGSLGLPSIYVSTYINLLKLFSNTK